MSRAKAVPTKATHEQIESSSSIFGFWVYIMTDCLLFATLFATFMVLRGGTNGGPSGSEIFSMPYVLAETIILLTSSFTVGLALLSARLGRRKPVLAWLGVTFVLGAAFLAMELNEFANLYAEGHDWRASAFLSAFFTLVGTHGLHITVGLLWMAVFAWQLARGSLNGISMRRLTMLGLFWHFLDIVWIFIFTIVFLFGEVKL